MKSVKSGVVSFSSPLHLCLPSRHSCRDARPVYFRRSRLRTWKFFSQTLTLNFWCIVPQTNRVSGAALKATRRFPTGALRTGQGGARTFACHVGNLADAWRDHFAAPLIPALQHAKLPHAIRMIGRCATKCFYYRYSPLISLRKPALFPAAIAQPGTSRKSRSRSTATRITWARTR